MSESKVERGALAAGGIAAILATGCCVLPFVLFSIGISGAWISTFSTLAPYYPVFIGAALVALYFAHRRIYQPAVECQAGGECALPQSKRVQKTLFWLVAALVLSTLVVKFLVPLVF